MDTKVVKEYIELLKELGVQTVEILRNTDAKDPNLREYIINFNNIFTNVQQYEMLLSELEKETADVSEANN